MQLNESKPCGKCKACICFNGQNGNGYQPCHNPISKPVPPTVRTPLIKCDEATAPSNVTPEQISQIKELTLKKVFLSVLLISIPILLWKLDNIIMAIKA